MSEYIEKLTEAIEKAHDCRATHFETEKVCEVHGGEPIWEGNVEIFHIANNADAKIAYGWAWEGEEGEITYIGILHVPPIESARDAVKAAIISGKFD